MALTIVHAWGGPINQEAPTARDEGSRTVDQPTPTKTRVGFIPIPLLVKSPDEAKQQPEALQQQGAKPKVVANLNYYPTNARLPEINNIVIRAIQTFPQGGGYATTKKALDQLKDSVRSDGKDAGLIVIADSAQPSFCSGATYLVFTRIISHLGASGKLALPPEVVKAYAAIGQPDGEGVWGRWNSNGPGTARLFAELDCGTNFSNIEHAVPGDFMKIWWSLEIGAKESGHSVVYLGRTIEKNEEVIHFWSSNVPGGYGAKAVPRSKIKRFLFSRLDRPDHLRNALLLPRSSEFLTSMLKRPALWDEVVRECRVEQNAKEIDLTPPGALMIQE